MASQLTDSTRQKVFDQRGHECIFCGVTGEQHKEEYGRDLDVHHVIPSMKGGSNDPENLIPVCISCHRTLEATQGKALGRIADKESNKDEIKELEEEIERERQNTQNILEGVDELFDNRLSLKLYVVHETRITTSRLLYAGGSLEDAQEAFEESENHVTMETINASAPNWPSDLSETDIRIVESKSEVLADRIRDFQEKD